MHLNLQECPKECLGWHCQVTYLLLLWVIRQGRPQLLQNEQVSEWVRSCNKLQRYFLRGSFLTNYQKKLWNLLGQRTSRSRTEVILAGLGAALPDSKGLDNMNLSANSSHSSGTACLLQTILLELPGGNSSVKYCLNTEPSVKGHLGRCGRSWWEKPYQVCEVP